MEWRELWGFDVALGKQAVEVWLVQKREHVQKQRAEQADKIEKKVGNVQRRKAESRDDAKKERERRTADSRGELARFKLADRGETEILSVSNPLSFNELQQSEVAFLRKREGNV